MFIKPNFEKVALTIFLLYPARILSMYIVSKLDIVNIIVIAIIFCIVWLLFGYLSACTIFYLYSIYKNKKSGI